MPNNPIALNPNDQPAVNAHAAAARECSTAQTPWNNTAEALEFAKHFQEVYRMTGIAAPYLAPYLMGSS